MVTRVQMWLHVCEGGGIISFPHLAALEAEALGGGVLIRQEALEMVRPTQPVQHAQLDLRWLQMWCASWFTDDKVVTREELFHTSFEKACGYR